MTAETREIHVTAIHYGLLADIQRGRVVDRVYGDYDETPYLDMPAGRLPVYVGKDVWEMERLGWCWRPVDSLVWQITGTGRAVLESSGL